MNSSSGFILGFLGGLLDLASATQILVGGMRLTQINGQMMGLPYQGWALGLVLLGIAVIVTTVLSATSLFMKGRRAFASLMVAYGAIMLGIGWTMSIGSMLPASVMGTASIYGYAMLIVGVLMAANGAAMSRAPQM